MSSTCPACGAPDAAEPTQTVVGDRIAWAISVRCDSCGDVQEIDGWDEPPDTVREAIIARDGLVRLRGVVGGAGRVPILAVFRRAARSTRRPPRSPP